MRLARDPDHEVKSRAADKIYRGRARKMTRCYRTARPYTDIEDGTDQAITCDLCSTSPLAAPRRVACHPPRRRGARCSIILYDLRLLHGNGPYGELLFRCSPCAARILGVSAEPSSPHLSDLLARVSVCDPLFAVCRSRLVREAFIAGSLVGSYRSDCQFDDRRPGYRLVDCANPGRAR